MTQLLTVDKPGHFITQRVTELLQNAGLRVSPTFSLQSARAGTACTCTRHAHSCDCNMEVFLVYGTEPLPATLVAQSHGGRTWFSLADNANAAASPELSLRIESVLATAQKNSKTAG